MNNLDTLRPEVREAVDAFDIGARLGMTFGNKGWNIIRAELLRLATRNAELEAKATRDHDWISDLLAENKKAEAELAALKTRMRPVARIENGEVRALMDPADEGKYVAVVVVEE